jgi:hypothetical protein
VAGIWSVLVANGTIAMPADSLHAPRWVLAAVGPTRR